MELYPESLEILIAEFSKLPTIGKKSAERLAMSIIKKDEEEVARFSRALTDVKKKVHSCKTCGNLTENELCDICLNPKRDRSIVTVVEDASNLIAIEKSGEYRGLYHVIGGLISPMRDISAENINIDSLLNRVEAGEIEEIILAISPTVDGETTSLFLNELLKNKNIRVSRIASGIPMGGNLEYFDSETLTRALEDRREF